MSQLVFALTNPGDVGLLPVPRYSGFQMVCSSKLGAFYLFLDLYQDFAIHGETEMCGIKCDPKRNWSVDMEHCEQIYKKCIKAGKKVKLFVLTHPNNPTGKLFSKENIKQIYRFCVKYKIQLISDEVYACSCLDDKNFYPNEYPSAIKLKLLLKKILENGHKIVILCGDFLKIFFTYKAHHGEDLVVCNTFFKSDFEFIFEFCFHLISSQKHVFDFCT